MEAKPDIKLQRCIEALKNGTQMKKEGNDAYVSKNYRLAVGKYHRALLQLKSLANPGVEVELFGKSSPPLPKEMLDERDQLISGCYNNLAACLLAKDKEPNYEKVVNYCQKVVEFDPDNVKAIFRMGTALQCLGKLEEAHAILTSRPVCQTEKQIQTLLRSIKEDEKAQDLKVKATYQKMFASDSKPKPQPATKSNGYAHSDPIVIKSGSSSGAASCQDTDLGVAGASDQGTQSIQVASASDEAGC